MAFGYGFPTDFNSNFSNWNLMPTTFGMDELALTELSPGQAWESARLNQMGQYANVPRFREMAMQGFVPAYGQYLLGGGEVKGRPDPFGKFGQWLPGGAYTEGTGVSAEERVNPALDPEAFARAARISDWMAGRGTPDPTFAGGGAQEYGIANVAAMSAGEDLRRNTAIGEFLRGDDARANQLAMAMAGMNITGGGIGAQAAQRGLGSLYDLYRARAASTPVGDASGFLGYLSRVRNQPGTV